MDSKTIDLTKLGHRIRFLRQGKGWSLADLAKECGLSKAYLSDLKMVQPENRTSNTSIPFPSSLGLR